MQEAHPDSDPDGEEAREGTAAHWVALDVMLRTGEVPAVGTLAPNGYPVDRAMLEGGEMLVEAVGPRRAAAQIEHRVAAHRSIHPDNDGTPDAYAIDLAARHVDLWDYKYGHRHVPAVGNWQLIDYLACIFETHGVAIGDVLNWTVSSTIVQPRCYQSSGPVRTWRPSGRELVDKLNDLRVAAYAAMAPDAPCKTGNHCYKCTAAFNCDAHYRSGQAAIEMVGTQTPLNMSPAALALWKSQVEQAAARLKSISDAVDERIMGMLRTGQPVPGYAIGQTQTRERWRDPAGAAALGDMFGIDLRKPDPDLVTPKQAAKLGIDPAVIKAYAETPLGAQKLVRRDGDDALAVFGPN